MTYTAMMPILAGAALGVFDKDKITALKIYAENVGLAFQIQDDLIGIFGDQEKTGKPIGSDLSQNKKTLLILKALESSSENQRKFIKNLLGKKSITLKEIEKIRKIIKETKSFDYSREKAQKLVQKAISAINKSNINESAKNNLIEIANYIINRAV